MAERHWRRPWLVALMLVGFGAILIRVAVVMHQPGHPTLITPDTVVGEPGSADLTVDFPWQHQGWCVGQFSVSVSESPTTVAVSDVLDHGPGSACAGIGSNGARASVDVTLSAPLGTRRVIHATDGSGIQVVSPTTS